MHFHHILSNNVWISNTEFQHVTFILKFPKPVVILITYSHGICAKFQYVCPHHHLGLCISHSRKHSRPICACGVVSGGNLLVSFIMLRWHKQQEHIVWLYKLWWNRVVSKRHVWFVACKVDARHRFAFRLLNYT